MANKNFVVHNGLTVGPLTIDAATGDINTPGNVTVTGDLGVSQISKNDSSISINDTGTSSTVVVAIDGTTEITVNSGGLTVNSGIQAGADIFIAGKAAATVDDATALSIALGG